jgi:hypothetical protein
MLGEAAVSEIAGRMSKQARSFAGALLFLGTALMGACGFKHDLGPEGQTLTTDTNDSSDTISLASALASVPALSVDGTEATLSAQVAAQVNAPKFIGPANCLAVAQVGNVVTYSFNGCEWGNATLEGNEVATFMPGDAPGSMAIDLQSQGLTANGNSVDHHATALVTFGAGTKTISWQGGFSGTTASGKHIEHSSDLTLFADSQACITVNGTTDTTIGLRGIHLEFDDLERCGPAGTCPLGTVKATAKLTGVKVTLVFDGTEDGVAKGALGGELDFKIDCTPAPGAP